MCTSRHACSAWVVLTLFVLAVAGAPAVGAASEWPNLRGPGFDGRVDAAGTFESPNVGLDLAWRIPLGSGYSGIVVSGGRAATLFSDGDGDWVAVFDAATGKEVWRYRLGKATKGHDGSDDGPLSSPTIGNGKVFALSPSGSLVALDLTNGKLAWSKQLEQDFGAKPPDFGFTTTPLLAGDLLVVQTGGSEARAIVALDSADGETAWSHGDGEVAYQSPSVMTLAGQRQVLASNARQLTGFDAESGKVLWEKPFGEEDHANSANPAFIGEDRFLVFVSGKAAVYKVSRGKDGFAIEELYRTDSLGQNYAPPVYHEGHVYGFRGQVLTCMDAANGERVWRSRPPGGDGVILVDGHLVIFGAKGNIVVAQATPEGYRERSRLQVLDGSSLTWPSFAGGTIFVRNLDEMAAVAVNRAASPTPAVGQMQDGHEFGRWVRSVEAESDRAAMVDAFMAQHGNGPVVEGEYVHFVYRGDVEDVGIAGSMNNIEAAEPMTRLPGTNLFYRSYRLEPGSRWEYRFLVNFETWTPDPLNPHTVPTLEGNDEQSELTTAGYKTPSYLDEPTGARGAIDTFKLASEVLGYEKEIQVWTPPGYADSDRSYPLLIVNDGRAWLEKGLMANSLDNLVGRSVGPVIVVFVDAYESWWTEAGGSATDDYIRMQVEELLPALKQRYRVVETPSAHAVMGNRFYAVTAAYSALKHPEIFGKASIQSVYTGLGAGEALESMLRNKQGSAVRFYVDWNRYDERNIDRGYDFAADTRRLAALIEQGGYSLAGGEVLDSLGWSGWRNRTGQALSTLFPN